MVCRHSFIRSKFVDGLRLALFRAAGFGGASAANVENQRKSNRERAKNTRKAQNLLLRFACPAYPTYYVGYSSRLR
jgi:hypothetical protein